MNNFEDFLFWRLAYFFVSKQEYRFIQLSKDQKELWLEKRENKEAQVIRLLRYDLDWSNWMQQDIERVALNGESIRKQITRGELSVLNLYISSYLPVDDFEFRIKKPFFHETNKKTKVTSKIIDRGTYEEQLRYLEDLFDDPISIPARNDYLEEEIEQLKRATLTAANKKIKEEKALFEQGKPFFTYVIIAIQVIMFLILEMNGGSTNTSTLIKFGAKFNPLILEGEWWRFFAPMVLHIGIMHLAMNTLALYYLGIAIERIFGKVRFLLIYILAGFSGSVASFLFSSSISAGASGAIFGCFGALLYFGMMYPKLFFRTMGANIFVVLAINLAFGFSVSGIDNAGHIGGLIGGFLATGIVHFPKQKKWGLQSVFLLLTVVGISLLLRFGYEHPSALLDEESTLVMSQEYIQSEEYEKAYSLLKESYKDEDDQPSAEYYFLLSYAEIKLEKINDAKQNLLKVIELDPDFHEAHYNLALLYLDENQTEKAREHLEKAIEIEPEQKEYTDLLKQLPS